MSTYRVVIDDTDNARISYSPGWNNNQSSDTDLMGEGATFSTGTSVFGGQHSTVKNSSLTFQFTGSSIEAYGYSETLSIDGTSDPQWACLVDGKTVRPFTALPPPKGNNAKLCGDANLDDNSHLLEIQVVTRGTSFHIDRIAYTPSSNVERVDLLWVGPTDPAFSITSASDGPNGTKFTNTKGARMSFNFYGIRLLWFGPILGDQPHDPTTISYTIDKGKPIDVPLAGLPSSTPSSPSETFNDQLFFNTGQLPLQLHTVTVTYDGDRKTPFALSYAYVYHATILSVSMSNTSQVPSSSISSPPSPPSPSSSSSAPSGAGKEVHLPIGEIIGGAVGGLVAIAILILCLCLWTRRRQRKRLAKPKPNLLGNEDDTPSDVTPFIINGPSTLQAIFAPFVKRNLNTPSSNVNSHDIVHGPTEAPEPIHKSSIFTEPAVQPAQHQDSGLRLPTIRESMLVVDLPPQYTAA